MLDPGAIKKGDRLVWHNRSKGSYTAKDGHGATVRSRPNSVDDMVDVTWDPGTTQNPGRYNLTDFDLEIKVVKPAGSNNTFCTCQVPNLIKNTVAGKDFMYCRTCKKERKGDVEERKGDVEERKGDFEKFWKLITKNGEKYKPSIVWTK